MAQISALTHFLGQGMVRPSSYHAIVANSKQQIQGTWSTSIYVQNSRLDDQPPSVMFRFYGKHLIHICPRPAANFLRRNGRVRQLCINSARHAGH